MANKLSFSQLSKYTQCAKSYEYHYIKRIREKTTTSALNFGTAIDKALNALLEDIKDGKDSRDYLAIFEKQWLNVQINKVDYSAPECTLIGYAKTEFQEQLLTDEDKKLLEGKILEYAPQYKDEYLTIIKEDLDHKKSISKVVPFPENEHKLLSLMNWLCLRQKGFLMIYAYIRDVVPQIEEVIDIQKEVTLASDTEDSMIGYIDAVVKLKGHDGPIILDNKTAAQPYDQTDVFYSQQLSIYSYILDIKKAAFAVMIKNIRLNKSKKCSVCGHMPETGDRNKTCNNELVLTTSIKKSRCHGEWIEQLNPAATTQLLVDEIPETNKELVIDNISEINNAIHHKVFPRNLETCNNLFGRKCPYIDLCYSNKMDGLVTLEKE